MKQTPFRFRSRAWGFILPVLILFVGLMLLVRWQDLPKANLLPSDLTPSSLEGVQRILILAPHCDDETLGAGGLIQSAVQAGIETRVVIATNGDGYRFATSEEFHKMYPTSRDYIRMGEVRQDESLAALAKLGIPAGHVYFLSYPDRGTPALLEKYWSPSQPYRSPFSSVNQSPYPRTYHPASVYAGADYLSDLISILTGYRPDLVVFPNPEDTHPDHWGLGIFTRLALAEISHKDSGYRPTLMTYLVHRPDYPVVRGLKPSAALVPPPALAFIYPNWLGWPLSREQTRIKGEAIQQYKSQIPLLRGLMESFVRSNELFSPVVSANMNEAVSGQFLDPSTWKDATGEAIQPVQPDPTGDVLSHKVIPGMDLKALYAARTSSGELWLCAQLHGKASREISYSIRLKSLADSGMRSYEAHSRHEPGQAAVTRSGNYFCSTTTISELGDPWGIALEATVESPDPLLPLDQTAWQLVFLKP
jgi:LmbE family N-acetylglucosaminyl deacetylase